MRQHEEADGVRETCELTFEQATALYGPFFPLSSVLAQLDRRSSRLLSVVVCDDVAEVPFDEMTEAQEAEYDKWYLSATTGYSFVNVLYYYRASRDLPANLVVTHWPHNSTEIH